MLYLYTAVDRRTHTHTTMNEEERRKDYDRRSDHIYYVRIVGILLIILSVFICVAVLDEQGYIFDTALVSLLLSLRDMPFYSQK